MSFRAFVVVMSSVACAMAGDIHQRFTGSTLDVYVASSTESRADIPGVPPAEHCLIVSVKTSDEMAQAVMVRVSIRLDDYTRISRTAVVERRTPYGWMVVRFPLGEHQAVEVVDIHVDNLRKTFADTLAPSL